MEVLPLGKNSFNLDLTSRTFGLNKYMHLLLKTASMNAVAVVVTNHKTQLSVDGFYGVASIGGHAVSYSGNYHEVGDIGLPD